MTYLVLARKWRPRSFETLIGQDHVVRALTHALSTQRLHHAWLFTGTRGVGKTTLSRILAKSLNCETGITATPCGVCQACTEIDAGRFVDYVELDAASNRGVDEMTQLLEQAVYAPGSGRFKVYMIDEVHMLTGHAFNAMLKTLEEPPAHVKFILATTDPQKIPVTVLSRCLQFNLKQMTAEAIVGHLQEVLEHEHIQFETPALRLLAQAASGSMRDALSLTDQAIAYSAGDLTSVAVQGMLGTIDQRHLVELLQALAQGSAAQVLEVADELAARGLSYSGALADLAVLLSRIAIQQRIPGTISPDDPQADDIVQLAGMLHPDQVQLFYSVAVHSRQELSLAPDEYAGFVMACLRMLALVPEGSPPPSEPPATRKPTEASGSDESSVTAPKSSPAPVAPAVQATTRLAKPSSTTEPQAPVESEPDGNDVPAWEDLPANTVAVAREVEDAPLIAGQRDDAALSHGNEAQDHAGRQNDAPAHADTGPQDHGALPGSSGPQNDSRQQAGGDPQDNAGPPDDVGDFETMHAADDDYVFDDVGYEPVEMGDPGSGDEPDAEQLLAVAEIVPPVFATERKKTRAPRLRDMSPQAWPALAASLPVTGLAAELARQSEWLGIKGEQINLRVAVRTLAESPGKSRLRTVLSEYFGCVIDLDVEYGATGDETAHAVEQAQKALRQQQAERAVANDPFVQALIQEFGAQVVPGSISATPQTRAA